MEQSILPKLPIVGYLKLSSRDGHSINKIEVSEGPASKNLSPYFKLCHQELLNFLQGKSKKINIKLDESDLSEFQKKVLLEMKRISYGKTKTYKDLALALNSKAYQAIGSACGRNPFMIIYPCHRVLGTHHLGGFAHGLKMKKALLDLESRE